LLLNLLHIVLRRKDGFITGRDVIIHYRVFSIDCAELLEGVEILCVSVGEDALEKLFTFFFFGFDLLLFV